MEIDFAEMIKSTVDQALKEYELKIGMTLKEAVEKQILKKPKVLKENAYTLSYGCPNCSCYLTTLLDGDWLGERNNYCRICGQALDWNDALDETD